MRRRGYRNRSLHGHRKRYGSWVSRRDHLHDLRRLSRCVLGLFFVGFSLRFGLWRLIRRCEDNRHGFHQIAQWLVNHFRRMQTH